MTSPTSYTSEDGASRIQLRAQGQTVWLTQAEMAELFDVTADNISLHLKNVFSGKELQPERTAEESSVVQPEGGREVRRTVTLYKLDAILAVGYRVRSPRGAQFLRWASTVLAEYLLKGFAMDDVRRWRRRPASAGSPSTNSASSWKRRQPMPPTRPSWLLSKTRSNDV